MYDITVKFDEKKENATVRMNKTGESAFFYIMKLDANGKPPTPENVFPFISETGEMILKTQELIALINGFKDIGIKLGLIQPVQPKPADEGISSITRDYHIISLKDHVKNLKDINESLLTIIDAIFKLGWGVSINGPVPSADDCASDAVWPDFEVEDPEIKYETSIIEPEEAPPANTNKKASDKI